ncbi:MAG: DUF2007 domain-containing protein [Kangiellaceae bacterium]
MKLVYRHENMSLVHSAKNILEMNEIDCLVKNEHGNTMGAEFGISNLAEVWVLNSDDHDKAFTLIDDKVINSSEKSSWVCSECQEENEGSFEICWKCQSDSPAS